MSLRERIRSFGAARPVLATALAAVLAGGLLGAGLGASSALTGAGASAAPGPEQAKPAGKPEGAPAVTLSEQQLGAVKVEPAAERIFPVQQRAVGAIDFNEDMTVPVYPAYQGKIISLFAQLGQDVAKGQTLFTIESPDLIQAESTLIAAAGVLDLTTRALARARQLYGLQGIAQKDLEQAVSDQQTAEGALKAARDSVRVFGKTDAEIDRAVSTRRVDSVLVVPSPVSGSVTARSASPGMLVQPGTAPAPYTVADLATIWMLAYVPEAQSPAFVLGQELAVSVTAFPGRVFGGRVTTIGANVDPNTHRMLVRAAVADPARMLRPGMLATFVIETGAPLRSVAVPLNGVVREGDGTMTVWVAAEPRRFLQRVVAIGQQRDGFIQVLEGLSAGERVVVDGAVFLSNEYYGGVS